MADEQAKNTKAKLSPEQLEKLRLHIGTKWKNGCPMCGNRTWSPSAFAQIALSPRRDGIVLGGTILPSIAMTCTDCGFTALLNAISSGVANDE